MFALRFAGVSDGNTLKRLCGHSAQDNDQSTNKVDHNGTVKTINIALVCCRTYRHQQVASFLKNESLLLYNVIILVYITLIHVFG